MKICLRRSQTCCGGMYLCSDNTISFAKAKLHFRCLSPASIFLQTTSSNNAAPAEKTDETEIKFFCLKYVSVSVFEHQQPCTSCFRARQANSAIQQRKFQFFGSKHFAEQFCAFTVSFVLAAQIRNIPEKNGKSQKFSKSAPDWFLFLFDLGIDLEAEAPAFHEKYSKICFLQKC